MTFFLIVCDIYPDLAFLQDDSADLLAAMIEVENFKSSKLKIMTSIVSLWKPAWNVYLAIVATT